MDLFLNPDLSDIQVCMKLQDGEEIMFPGHSWILKSASKVFRVTLDPKFNEGKTGVVEIQVPGDQDLAVNFFRFIYTKKLDECEADQYITLMKVAHMYEISELSVLCESRVLQKLTPYSVSRIYRSLNKYATQQFIVNCQDFMLSSAFIIFARDLHLLLDEEAMKVLLESDKLNTLNEDSVIKALLRWGCKRSIILNGSSETDTKKHIIGLLPLIKWHLIENVDESEEISNLLAEFKIDTDESSTGDRETSGKPSMNSFVDVWNISSSGMLAMPSGFANGERELITFCVSADILLLGLAFDIILYAKVDWQPLISIHVNEENVTEFGFSKEMWKSTGHTVDASACVTRVELEFAKPLQLQQTKLHKIKLKSEYTNGVALPEITSECFPHLCPKDVKFYTQKDKAWAITDLFYFVP